MLLLLFFQYIRLTSDADPVDVLTLLLREWQLDLPKLLVSVIGGEKSLKLSSKLKQLFSDGLCQVKCNHMKKDCFSVFPFLSDC